MARDVKLSSRRGLPEVKMDLSSFNKGLITLIDESLLPPNAAKESKNLFQKMDGRWTPRWGSDYYGVDATNTITGAAVFTTDAGVNHLVIASGTAIKRSTDDGATWSSCTGSSITNGKKCYFQQIGSYLYIANGTDNLIRYDGTTTLQVYSAISTPGTITATKTGLASTTFTASYKVTAVNGVGETAASTAGTVTISKTRDNWTSGSDYITVTFSKVTGATAYNIYYSDERNGGGQHCYVGSVTQPSGATVTFTDTGEEFIPMNTYVTAPAGDTTSGPKFAQMELSGNRLWATLDPNNPWRVYWSGAGPDIGAFSEFNGGGFIDLEKGGRERPKAVVHYRDGKGGAYATVLTSDPEGIGSIWQVALEGVTVGNTSFVIPSAIKIVGSVGSNSTQSVVKVRNDVQFFNRRGWFSLRSKPQMLNLLSTDEISANIRPDIEQMTGTALSGVCAYYYQSKVFCSMPYGNSTNNRIYVNDTERLNWSGPWTFGVERFFEYTDTNGENHLLAVPISGSRLIEISDNIQGDLGVAFETKYVSGLYPIDKDRNAFAKIRYVYFEFNNPVGNINITVLGTEKKKGYSNLKSVTISDTLSNAGYDTQQFSSAEFSDTSVTPTTFAQSSVKKRIRVNKLLNNIQFVITTNNTNSDYTLLNIQAKGFIIPTGDPQRWKSLT
jgi:hypothetical protein